MEEKTMKINHSTQTIEMSKKFAKAAAKFNSNEYKQLQAARKDNIGYRTEVVDRKVTGKKSTYKGLTYDYMENYISAHDDENSSIMEEYLMLRGKSEEAEELLAETFSYLEMKDWFLKKFPEIAAFHKKREAALAA